MENFLKSYRHIIQLLEDEQEKSEKNTFRMWFALRASGDDADIEAAQRVSDLGFREVAEIRQAKTHFQEFVKAWARENYSDNPEKLEFWNAEKL